jgi:hypothetical protein
MQCREPEADQTDGVTREIGCHSLMWVRENNRKLVIRRRVSRPCCPVSRQDGRWDHQGGLELISDKRPYSHSKVLCITPSSSFLKIPFNNRRIICVTSSVHCPIQHTHTHTHTHTPKSDLISSPGRNDKIFLLRSYG